MSDNILRNQLVIMEGIRELLWDSMKGSYNAVSDYIDDLKCQIKLTREDIKEAE